MKNILCYGDSNTHGLIPTGGRHPWGVRWTSLVQKALGEEAHIIEEGLEGRTTVWEDPIEGFKSGKKYLIPCLETHKPLDLIILMLGTNDLKNRFHLNAFDIALGNAALIKMIKSYFIQMELPVPKVLLVSPIHLGEEIAESRNGGFFDGHNSLEISKKLAGEYEKIARQSGCEFLDASLYAKASKEDQLHMDEENHEKLAAAIIEKIRKIYE